MNKKPTHFMLFKIVGAVGFALAVLGVILVITGFNDFESNNFMIGGFLVAFGLFVGFMGTAIGFSPEIAKMGAKGARYIQEENKDNLTAIASNTADIMSAAITTTAGAIKEGFQKKKFCKHCGKEIDSDSKFCPICGKEQ